MCGNLDGKCLPTFGRTQFGHFPPKQESKNKIENLEWEMPQFFKAVSGGPIRSDGLQRLPFDITEQLWFLIFYPSVASCNKVKVFLFKSFLIFKYFYIFACLTCKLISI